MQLKNATEGADEHPARAGHTAPRQTPRKPISRYGGPTGTRAARPATEAITRSPITNAELALFNAAFAQLEEPISDSSFAISLGWAGSLDLSYAVIDEHLCVFSAVDGDLSMILPPMALTRSADSRLGECIEKCFAVMDLANGPEAADRSRIEYVSDEMLMRIRRFERFAFSASPMPGDYVYPRRAMVELAGGPLKGKRKLRHRFERENRHITTARITPGDIDECKALLGHWRSSADQRHEGEANERLIGTDVLRKRDESFTVCLLENLDTLGLDSMLVRSDGRLVGFTIGERLTPDQAVIYVEKTDPDVVGTPQFIFSEFCRVNFGDVSEINVGDDWGIESLRYTKMSYRPSRMIPKSMLTRQVVPEVNAIEPMTVESLHSGSSPVTHSQAATVTSDQTHLATHPHPHPLSRPSAGHGGDDHRVVIRRAVRADAIDIVEIEAAAFSEGDRFSVRQVRRLIDNPRAIVLVAQSQDQRGQRVVGWIVALVRSHRRWRSGRIYGVAVANRFKGMGVGRALVAESIDHLGHEGIERVYLEVRTGNAPAIALYESLGFEAIALLGDYYGDGAHGMRMRRVGDSQESQHGS